MPEVEFTTTTKLPVDTVWEFVREMDNWAAFVAGYESHEKSSDDDSEWILKGDVGVLARTVKFAVHVDEWAGPERVVFSLKGLNEPMEGGGTFLLSPHEEGTEVAIPAKPKDGIFTRFFTAIARFFYGLVHGKAERAEGADTAPSKGASKLVFRLRVDPGGPMAPMINAMMKPMMMPAAEDLANQIMATLEKRHGLS